MSWSGRVRIYPFILGMVRYILVRQGQDISFHIRHGQIYPGQAGSGYILVGLGQADISCSGTVKICPD
jgi:hypothetical protein